MVIQMRRRDFVFLSANMAAAGLLGTGGASASAGMRFKTIDGDTSRLSNAQFRRFEQQLDGRVIQPGAPAYDSARAIWNARIDHTPGAIVHAENTSDIVQTVRFAADNGIELSIRAGGHNHSGFAVSDGGLMLDLSRMRSADLSANHKRISAAPGMTFAEFDALGQQAGLATTGPIVSMVGLPGYTLGGGIGWLHRKFGAGCDNLIGADVVLASGEVVQASERENEELLWALRGGGGNFGVVSRLDYRLHRLSNVLAGLIFYPLDALETVGKFVDGYLDDAPDDLNVWMLHRLAPPSPALPTDLHGKPVVILAVTWTGGKAEGDRIVAPLAEIQQPLAHLVHWRNYAEWQRALDGAWADDFCNEWVGGYLDTYDSNLRTSIAKFVESASSPYSDFKLARLGGEFARMGPEDTAFGPRSSRYAYVIQTRWPVGEHEQPHLEWTQAFHRSMRARDTGKVYANFIGKDEPRERFRDAYSAASYERLRRIKSEFDPHNMFRQNVNIEPG